MDKSLLREFFVRLNTLDEKEYFLSSVAYWTAPTQKGMKPSSLVSFSTKGRNLYRLWEKYKHELHNDLNLDFFVLRETSENRLILFYNRPMLERRVLSRKNMGFLITLGYDESMSLDQSLEFLKMRFESMCPHEIGVFLGIPIEDVAGFIEHKGDNFMFCRYWKVYHNPERAKNMFQRYDLAKVNVINSIFNIEEFGKVALESV